MNEEQQFTSLQKVRSSVLPHATIVSSATTEKGLMGMRMTAFARMGVASLATTAVLLAAGMVADQPSAVSENDGVLTAATIVQQADAKTKISGLPKAGYWKWSAKSAPNYYKKIGKAKVTKKVGKGKIKYSKLDSRGRTQRAVGKISYKLVADSAGWRQQFDSRDDPSGWPKNKRVSISLPNGRTYNGWLWNRSHLIADSLGGDAQRNNLVTGTRTQNVGANNDKGGMAYCETKVRNWLYAHHGGTVYYSATPVYKGKELIPRNVVVDMKSSDGSINERVVVYNTAKGISINYKKGTSVVVKKAKAKTTKKSKKKVTAKKASSGGSVYLTQTGSKYHRRSCSTLSRSRNLTKVSVSYAKKYGYDACKVCRP